MNVGTKSILYGAHCFFLHPWFVAAAWRKLYGFPWDLRLWVAFFVHDLGYWGKPNMDGPEGETHVELGAKVMYRLFDARWRGAPRKVQGVWMTKDRGIAQRSSFSKRWHDFSLYHSRFYAKEHRAAFSRLCVADKLVIVLTPAWLYLPMARATGEIREYMKLAEHDTSERQQKYASMNLTTSSEARWYADVQEYMRRWVEEHKGGKADDWTPDAKEAKGASGVWK